MDSSLALATVSPPTTETDRDRFSELIREHHRPLLAYARAISGDATRARDIVQDAFVAAWQNLERFDITRDFSAWLRGIVRNKWRESCRCTNRELSMADPELARIEEAMQEWTEAAAQTGLLERLAECRGKLPDALAEAVSAYYDGDRPGGDAARRLGIQSATLRKRLERARHALRKCLESSTD